MHSFKGAIRLNEFFRKLDYAVCNPNISGHAEDCRDHYFMIETLFAVPDAELFSFADIVFENYKEEKNSRVQTALMSLLGARFYCTPHGHIFPSGGLDVPQEYYGSLINHLLRKKRPARQLTPRLEFELMRTALHLMRMDKEPHKDCNAFDLFDAICLRTEVRIDAFEKAPLLALVEALDETTAAHPLMLSARYVNLQISLLDMRKNIACNGHRLHNAAVDKFHWLAINKLLEITGIMRQSPELFKTYSPFGAALLKLPLLKGVFLNNPNKHGKVGEIIDVIGDLNFRGASPQRAKNSRLSGFSIPPGPH